MDDVSAPDVSEHAADATGATSTAQLPHKNARPDSAGKAILEVDNLQMYFPVKSSGLLRRTVGHVQAVDGVSFEVPTGC